MTQPNASTALARAVVDELARCGVGLAVISPGSRSAALAIAAHGHEAIDVVVSVDERSAAFHALGWAKATGAPAMTICTSGTAPANYLPAIVEANMCHAPLVIVSADRPEELRGVGANQTIDQIELYGSHVRRFAHIESPETERDVNPDWRSTTSAVAAAAKGGEGMPGPVHLNIGFREPTVPVTDDGRTSGEAYPFEIGGRADGSPWLSQDQPVAAIGEVSGSELSRGLVIAGEGTYDREILQTSAARLGWPVLATALSGMRGGSTITGYHHLLARGIPDGLTPEFVYAVGSIGPSDRLEALVASAPKSVRVDYWGRHIDPSGTATQVLHADPSATLASLTGGGGDASWAGAWRSADRALQDAVGDYLKNEMSLSGAGVAAALNDVPWRTLVAASSLPIREVDAHVRHDGGVVANRGASGIDGFVSTALGVARAGAGTIGLSGDLSLLHDANGFLIRPRPDLVVVVLDNDGGGLFDRLPTATHAPDYERLFVTPHGRDLSHLAALFDLRYEVASRREDLIEVVLSGLETEGVTLIRVPVDRSVDLGVSNSLDELGADIASTFES